MKDYTMNKNADYEDMLYEKKVKINKKNSNSIKNEKGATAKRNSYKRRKK